MSWEVWIMKSRTSFCNGTLLRHFWRRFWPLPLAVLLTVLLSVAAPLIGLSHQSGMDPMTRLYQAQNHIYSLIYFMLFCTAGASFLAAALVFHHLHSQKEIQFYQGLPLRRRTLYFASWLAGFTLLALPMILGLGLSMLLAVALGFGQTVPAIAYLLLGGILGLLVFYGMAVLACVLAGQTFGAVLIYVGMHCAAFVILGGAGEVASRFMPGIVFQENFEGVIQWLTPLYRLLTALGPRYETVTTLSSRDAIFTMAVGFTELWAAAVYGVIGLALSFLSGWLYQIRRSERAGEMVAFLPVRRVCGIFGAAMICVAGSLLALNIDLFPAGAEFQAAVISALVFGAIGYLAAEMIIHKTLRIIDKRTLLGCGAFLAALLVILGLAKLDPLDRVGRVPETGTVESATVNFSYAGFVDMDPEDAAAIHRAVLDNRDLLAKSGNPDGWYSDLQIIYNLKNGRVLRRIYSIRTDRDEYGVLDNPVLDILDETLSQPDYCYQTWFNPLPEEGVTAENCATCSMEWYQVDQEGEWRSDYREYSPGDAEALFEALQADIQAGRVTPNGLDSGPATLGTLMFEVYTKPYEQTVFDSYQEYAANALTACVYIGVTEDMTETLALLDRPPAKMQSLG